MAPAAMKLTAPNSDPPQPVWNSSKCSGNLASVASRITLTVAIMSAAPAPASSSKGVKRRRSAWVTATKSSTASATQCDVEIALPAGQAHHIALNRRACQQARQSGVDPQEKRPDQRQEKPAPYERPGQGKQDEGDPAFGAPAGRRQGKIGAAQQQTDGGGEVQGNEAENQGQAEHRLVGRAHRRSGCRGIAGQHEQYADCKPDNRADAAQIENGDGQRLAVDSRRDLAGEAIDGRDASNDRK
jgi:hypothetical protein